MPDLVASLRRLRAVPGFRKAIAPVPALSRLAGELGRRLGAVEAPGQADYDALVGYFAAGVAAYRSPGRALVLYPGMAGTRGLIVDGMEGFARSAPLLAAWARTRGPAIALPNGTGFDVLDHIAAGLAAGTDPHSAEFWGEPQDLDQRIVESADIAFTLWLLAPQLRAALPARVWDRVLDWLARHLSRRVYGGNWHLFPLIVDAVLQGQGRPRHPGHAGNAGIIRSMAIGDGWFSEGHRGVPDLYNAWQMQYFLHFYRLIAAPPAAECDGPFIEAAQRAFAPGFLHFFSPAGFPLYGRSLCYKFALPAPLVLASTLERPPVSAGQARRAMDVVWRHFAALGGLAHGTVVQGPLGQPRPELLENYCSRSSCLWSLRSLIAAYLAPPEAPFWKAAPEPLPVERGSFTLTIPGPGITATGDAATGLVTLRFGQAQRPARTIAWERHGLLRRAGERLLGRPLRPDNYDVKYLGEQYRSDNLLWS